MGYESKIIVGERISFEKRDFHCCSTIAVFNMGCMSGNFINAFDKPVDFDVIIDNEEKDTSVDKDAYKKDRYNDICKYTSKDRVIKALKAQMRECPDYTRRPLPLLAYLNSIDENDFNELVVIHYGY